MDGRAIFELVLDDIEICLGQAASDFEDRVHLAPSIAVKEPSRCACVSVITFLFSGWIKTRRERKMLPCLKVPREMIRFAAERLMEAEVERLRRPAMAEEGAAAGEAQRYRRRERDTRAGTIE